MGGLVDQIFDVRARKPRKLPHRCRVVGSQRSGVRRLHWRGDPRRGWFVGGIDDGMRINVCIVADNAADPGGQEVVSSHLIVGVAKCRTFRRQCWFRIAPAGTLRSQCARHAQTGPEPLLYAVHYRRHPLAACNQIRPFDAAVNGV